MNRKKLQKIKAELAQRRRSPQKARELQSLAARLGRKVENRGKHPMWVSTEFDELYPLSIPDHSGRDLSPGVRKIILNQLEDDILAWEERLSEEDEDGSEDDVGD